MSGKGTKLLPFCMLLILAVGAFMPRAAFSLQDYHLATQTEKRPLDSIQLTLHEGEGVKQTLLLLSSGYTQILLQEGNKLTPSEAEAAAQEAVDLLSQESLLPDVAWENATAIQVFAAISNSDRSHSAVIWGYSFTGDTQSTCTVWIDDATGKLVSVSYLASGRSSSYPTPTVELPKKSLAERWAAFLQEYYGLDAATAEEAYRNTSETVFTLEFAWTEEEHPVSFKLPLMLRGDNVFFCW